MIDRLIVNANAYTLDDSQPRVSAIALSGEQIVAVGDDSLRSMATPKTQIDDLNGAMLLPGLVDAHIHWQWTSLGLREIELFDVPSKEEAVLRVGPAVEKARPCAWRTRRRWAKALG